MIIYTDRVIKKIGSSIAAHEPERGGALLGVPNSNLITDFIEDPLAEVSHASYFPSKELTLKVNEKELRHGLQFKGVIHSHPSDFNVPSGQDENAFALGLAINPRLSGFVAPIVTVTKKYGQYDASEQKLYPRGQLTSYVAYRAKKEQQESSRKILIYEKIKDSTGCGNTYRNSKVFVEKTSCEIMPIDAHTCSLTNKLQPLIGEVMDSMVGYLEINGVLFISETYRFNDGEVIILFPPDYPTTKPFILVSRILRGVKGDAIELSFPWLFSYAGVSQLADVCGKAIIDFFGIRKNIGHIQRRNLGSDGGNGSPPTRALLLNHNHKPHIPSKPIKPKKP